MRKKIREETGKDRVIQGAVGTYQLLDTHPKQEATMTNVDTLLRDSMASAVLQAYMTRGQNIHAAQRERELVCHACYEWANSLMYARDRVKLG